MFWRPFYLNNNSPQVYEKVIQIGRVVLLEDGPDKNKLCAIVDVIDANRVCKISTVGIHSGFSNW